MLSRKPSGRGLPVGVTAGFTLVEILVSVGIIALLSAAILPPILSRFDEAKSVATATQLVNLREASRMFQMDMRTLPREMNQLVDRPGTRNASDVDLFGETISPEVAAEWKGPYLDMGTMVENSLAMIAGGTVVSPFILESWAEDAFMAIKVVDVTEVETRRISEILDGDSIVDRASAGDEIGRVRWRPGTETDTLVFLALPLPGVEPS